MSNTAFKWPRDENLVFVRPPKEEYNGKLSPFYDSSAFPELQPFLDNWEGIREEILNFEAKLGHIKFMNTLSHAEIAGDGMWSLTYLMSFRRKFHKNIKLFPFIWSVVQQVPNCVFAGISILPPHTEIKPHFGDTNGIVRGHLGLVIPAPYPDIAIHVGDEEQGWEEGKILCFTNVIKHWVWNRTNHRRYVIMFDFVPEPLKDRKHEICSRGLGSQSFIFLYKSNKWFRKLPELSHEPLCRLFSWIWYLYLPLQRQFKFLK